MIRPNRQDPSARTPLPAGQAVSIACYVSGLSVPNQVSNVVRELATGKRFFFGDVVPKGFEDPVRLYEVRWREEGGP